MPYSSTSFTRCIFSDVTVVPSVCNTSGYGLKDVLGLLQCYRTSSNATAHQWERGDMDTLLYPQGATRNSDLELKKSSLETETSGHLVSMIQAEVLVF